MHELIELACRLERNHTQCAYTCYVKQCACVRSCVRVIVRAHQAAEGMHDDDDDDDDADNCRKHAWLWNERQFGN
eukprot:2094230-Pleurochrysis_carterae.AAC.2